MKNDEIVKLEERMLSGEPFTYGALCLEFKTAGREFDRKIDATIQRLRRKGKIAFTREGGAVVWRRT